MFYRLMFRKQITRVWNALHQPWFFRQNESFNGRKKDMKNILLKRGMGRLLLNEKTIVHFRVNNSTSRKFCNKTISNSTHWEILSAYPLLYISKIFTNKAINPFLDCKPFCLCKTITLCIMGDKDFLKYYLLNYTTHCVRQV